MWGDDTPPFYAFLIRCDADGNRTHHIHMVEAHFEIWDRLFFRDYLIEHPHIAQDYAKLKRELSNTHVNDRVAYTEAKTDFIVRISSIAKGYYGEAQQGFLQRSAKSVRPLKSGVSHREKEVLDMLFIKCILGAIWGAIRGLIAFIVVYLALWIVVGLATWNSSTGEAVASFAVLLVPAGIIIGIVTPLREDAEKRRQQEERERQEAKRKQDELDAECRSLASLHESAKETFLSLNKLVPFASRHLNKAEHEFSEGAFEPFWAEVESATNQLAAYHQGIQSVERGATEYSRRSSVLSVRVPSFKMPLGELRDARPVAARLSQIVRRAQKDIQFATIYQQRKTNQLLYAGFGTLASAIDRMQTSIVGALEDLSVSLNTTLDSLVAVSQAQADMVTSMSEAMADNFEKQRKYEAESLDQSKRQSSMLDNIQRRRKPS